MNRRLMPGLLLAVMLMAVFGALGACESNDDSATENDDDTPATDDDAATDDDSQPTDDDGVSDDDNVETRQIDFAALRDKTLGSWVGQMAGVAWAASTEFDYTGRMIPDDKVPEWKPSMVNAGYIQDDVYVEIPFIVAMKERGATVDWKTMGDYFRDTKFPLWHANDAARDNLRDGMSAPDSGHYVNNEHCDDIDWQIEADYVGAMCPGLVNAAIELAWRTGHVMNYGDGVYGGVFFAAMHAAAFFADELDEIIAAGRQSLPEGSKYRTVVDDVLGWHAAGNTWEETWQLLQDKWGEDDRCPSYDKPFMRSFNIDAKLNGAYVLMGLLYGGGDFELSVRLAMRGGQDSDCNGSTAGAILGNWLGYSGIPATFKEELNPDRRFLTTDYTLAQILEVNLELMRQILQLSGATFTGEGEQEVWTIPLEGEVVPPILEQWPAEANSLPEMTALIAAQSDLTVSFTATAADPDGIAAYEWYFGDLQRASGEQAQHTYAEAGTYSVIVYTTDAIGNTTWQELSVTVP